MVNRNRRRFMLRTATVCLSGLTALLLTACPKTEEEAGGPGGAGGMQGPPPVSVVVAPVEIRDYAPAIDLVGDIRAKQRTTLAAEVAGKVMRISHRVGEEHPRSAGALIQIDPATYQTQLAGAEASLRQAQQDLARIESGARVDELQAQEAAVQAARAAFEQAQDNYERQRELYEEGVIAESALISAQKQAEAAEAALQAQIEILENLESGSRKEEIEAAKARVSLQQSTVDAARLALSRTNVSVPFDAAVTALFVEVGQFVAPGTPLAEVIASGDQEAWFNLPEDTISRVGEGNLVEIRTDAIPDQLFSGRVISTSASADPTTRQFPVRVSLTDARLLPGMAVRGRIIQGTPKPTIMVSQDAVHESRLGLVVYRMTPPGPNDQPPMEGMPPLPSFETVSIEAGERIDGLAVILKGDLKAGDMLVTRGKEGLYPTAKIVPTNLMGGEGGAEGGAPAGAGAGAADAPGADTQAPPAEGGSAETGAAGEGESGQGGTEKGAGGGEEGSAGAGAAGGA